MLKTLDHTTGAAYDDDVYLWTKEQARLLRERRFAELDLMRTRWKAWTDRTSATSKAASTSSSPIF